jgi:adenylate cyclase
MDYEGITTPAEHRMVLAVADMEGFVKLSRAMSDARLFEILDGFYEQFQPPVEAAGGRIVKFMGDAALLCFPADRAAEAVEALHQVQARTQAWLQEQGAPFPVHVRAHVGTVVCGPMGTPDDKRFDIIGRPVMELFRLPGGPFVLSPDLEEALEG